MFYAIFTAFATLVNRQTIANKVMHCSRMSAFHFVRTAPVRLPLSLFPFLSRSLSLLLSPAHSFLIVRSLARARFATNS